MPLVKQQPGLPVRIVYGLDIQRDFAAVVAARLQRGRISFETLYSGTTEQLEQALQPAARRVRLDLSLDRAALAAAMPATDSILRWLEVPLNSKSKARKVLPSQLDIQLPFPLEKCRYGFPLLQPGTTGLRALAIAAREEPIHQRLGQCRELRFDPHILDHEGLALWREGLEQPGATPSDTRILCYLGHEYSVWAIGKGRDLESVHASRIGSRQWVDPHQRQEWQSRVLRMLRGRNENETASGLHWYWTGPGRPDAEMDAWLQQNVAVTTLTALDEPDTFLARGLARRALLQEADAWNFRDGEIEHPQAGAWHTRALRRTAAAGIAAGLLICAANAGLAAWMAQQQESADQALATTAREVTGLTFIPRGQETLIGAREAETQAALYAPFLRAVDTEVSRDVRNLLEQARDQNWQIASLTVRPGHWTLNGTADDWDVGKQLEMRLRGEGWDVTLTRQDAVAVEHVRFSITARRPTP